MSLMWQEMTTRTCLVVAGRLNATGKIGSLSGVIHAEEADAEVFKKEFGGEPMHLSEKGHGKNWARWKGTRNSKPRSP